MIEAYSCLLFTILKEKPHLCTCLVRCRHCGIYFITYPANRNRTDLGCPFGCREAHRKARASQRATDYYRTPQGKDKKRALNARRNAETSKTSLPELPSPLHDPDPAPPPSAISSDVVSYSRMVISLLEGRQVPLSEIVHFIGQLRQHTFFKRKKRRYRGGKFRFSFP